MKTKKRSLIKALRRELRNPNATFTADELVELARLTNQLVKWVTITLFGGLTEMIRQEKKGVSSHVNQNGLLN